jgi:uncharacterized membrane protein
MPYIIYLCILIPLVLIDALWLSLMGGTYRQWLGHIFAPSFSFGPVLVFYPLYALGLYVFVVLPAISAVGIGTVDIAFLCKIFLKGALLGLIAYGAYDLTNQATLRDWPVVVSVIDMAWGAFVTGSASAIAVVFWSYFK